MSDNPYKAPESDLEKIRKPIWNDVKTPNVIYLSSFLMFFYLAAQLPVIKHAIGTDTPVAAGSAASAMLMLYTLAAFLIPAGVARLNRPSLILAALIMGISAALMVLKIGVAVYTGKISGLLWVTLAMTALLAMSAWVCIRPSTLQASAARAEFKKHKAMISYVAKNLSKR